ncbi:MAG: DUF3343 domain-containing protein [Firmicutes bacterium]|nr:DUF3343 domain-containing protein [Bacillota bacterium]
MAKKETLVLTFAGMHQTMKADQVLKKAGISHSVIPSPPHVGQLCQYAVMVDRSVLSRCQDTLNKTGTKIMRIFQL